MRAPKLDKTVLQKALSSKPTDGVYSNCLPLEKPACHREANCRVTQMHHSHNTPPNSDRLSLTLRGGTSNSIGTIATPHHPNKAQQCHLAGTEVIEVIKRST